jgi:hypothetical protein
MRRGKKKYLRIGAVVLLVAAGAGLWWGRTPLLTWFYMRGLIQADDGNRELWAERVAGLDRAAVPRLLDLLTGDDRACANARAALVALIRRRGGDDPRGEELARRLADGFVRLSVSGQREVLQFETVWLRAEDGKIPLAEVARAAARQLPDAARADDGAVRGAALDLASALLARSDYAESIGPCRELAVACFGDQNAENRARAAQIALHPGMDLQQQSLPLLRDPSPEVRRLAMLVVGPAQSVISTDDLLHWLHDPDSDVRRLCEMALVSRKVPQKHIRLGRMLTDPDFHVRLNVLDELHSAQARDIDAGIWLRYLSHDPKESVRVAAVRAAVEQRFYTPVDLRDRMEQMSKSDPSDTVRQLVGYSLSQIRD